MRLPSLPWQAGRRFFWELRGEGAAVQRGLCGMFRAPAPGIWPGEVLGSPKGFCEPPAGASAPSPNCLYRSWSLWVGGWVSSLGILLSLKMAGPLQVHPLLSLRTRAGHRSREEPLQHSCLLAAGCRVPPPRDPGLCGRRVSQPLIVLLSRPSKPLVPPALSQGALCPNKSWRHMENI